MKSRDRLRFHISDFKGAAFNTTELRNVFNMTNLVLELKKLAEAGEIEYCGVMKTRGKTIGVWREIKLAHSGVIRDPKIEQPSSTVPGWRAAFPFLFSDPKLPGRRSVFHKGEL